MRFHDYAAARSYAGEQARKLNLDMALRKWDYDPLKAGRFSVTIASRNDSDYATAEIVKPSNPAWSR